MPRRVAFISPVLRCGHLWCLLMGPYLKHSMPARLYARVSFSRLFLEKEENFICSCVAIQKPACLVG